MANKKFQETLNEIKKGTYKSTKIILSQCEINDEDWKKLKKAILDNKWLSKNLKELDLEYNKLTSFDGSGLSNLKELDLFGNNITSFDGSGLSNLKVLNLSHNKLTSFDGSGLSFLTKLCLAKNELTSFDGSELFNLKVLNLSGNNLISFDGSGLSALDCVILTINTTTLFSLMFTKSKLYKKFIPNNTMHYIEVFNKLKTREIKINPIKIFEWRTMLLNLMEIAYTNGIFYAHSSKDLDYLSFISSEIYKFIYFDDIQKNDPHPRKELMLESNENSLLKNWEKELQEYKKNNQQHEHVSHILVERLYNLHIKSLRAYKINTNNIKILIDEHVKKVLNLEIQASKMKLLNLFKDSYVIKWLCEKNQITSEHREKHPIFDIFQYMHKNCEGFMDDFIGNIVKAKCKIYLQRRLKKAEKNLKIMFSQSCPQHKELIFYSKKFKHITGVITKGDITKGDYLWLNFTREYRKETQKKIENFYSNLLKYAEGKSQSKEEGFKNVLFRIRNKCENLPKQTKKQQSTQTKITSVKYAKSNLTKRRKLMPGNIML